MKRHYIIRFNDLSEETQLKIGEGLRKDLEKSKVDLSDGDEVTKRIVRACDRSWVEMEITL